MLTNEAVSDSDVLSSTTTQETAVRPTTSSYFSMLTTLYHKLPIPSVVTGYVDEAPRVMGHLFFGAASQPSQSEWIGDVITACDKEIKADPKHRGICRFYIMHLQAAYISDPRFIQKIYYNKSPSEVGKLPVPKNGDNSGIYQFLFGDSILTFPHTDPRWPKERSFLAGSLLAPARLRMQAQVLKAIAKDAMASLEDGCVTNVDDLREFGNRMILDMVCQAQLSLFNVTPEEKLQLTSIVARGVPEMGKLSSTLKLKMGSTFYWRPKMPLDEIKRAGELLIDTLLRRNKEYILTLHEDPNQYSLLTKYVFEKALSRAEAEFNQKIQNNTLTDMDNQIQAQLLDLENQLNAKMIQLHEYDRKKLQIYGVNFAAIDLFTDEIKKFTSMVLFAGYETTSTFLFFNLLLMADPQHKHIVQQVRETTDPEARIKLLDQIIREAGRLYPSFPILKDSLNEDVNLDGIVVKKGTLIFMSPLRLQRDNTIYAQPEKFILGRKLDELSESSNYILFGQKPRICPGRNLAFLEIKTILTELLPAFNMELDPQLTHPFPVAERFGLQLADSMDSKRIGVKVMSIADVDRPKLVL